MDLNKGISTPIAILIIVAIAVLASGIIYWQYQQIKTPEGKQQQQTEKGQQLEEEIDTSDWKTYTNKEYGFKISHPEEWCVFTQFIRSTEEHYVTFSNLCKEEEVKETIENVKSNSEKEINNDLYLFGIRIWKLKHKSLEAWLEDSKEYMESAGISASTTKETVGSHSGYRVCLRKDKNQRECTKVATNGEERYILGVLYPKKCRAERCKIFNQMISTFEFVE